MLDLLTNTYALAGSSTKGNSYQTSISTNSNSNSNNINVGNDDLAALGAPKKKKSNTGMIAGIVAAVVIVIVAVVIAVWLFRRTKKNRETAAAVAQQPLMTQPPIDTMPPPGSYPSTPVPYGAPTPVPYNPPTPGPYPPNPAPFDAYGAVADKDKVPYYNNQPVPPNTIEMPANQSAHGQQGNYQPPALPAAGIVEASGDSAYRSPSTGQNPNNNNYGQQPSNPHQLSEMSGQSAGSHLPGHPPPNQTGPVYEMDSRQYGQN